MAQVVQPDDRTSTESPRPRELAMSAAWNAALTRHIQTTDGREISIVFHGTWSHGFGPDFKNAMLDFGDGKLITGDIELHYSGSDWIQHGHHLDANYNNVVLHVVSENDLPETRCINGRIVPTAVLQISDAALFAINRRLPVTWDDFGGSVCAAHVSSQNPAAIRRILQDLGDRRLRAKADALQADILEYGREAVLVQKLFGAFGYSANKAPMEHLAELTLRYDIPNRADLGSDDRPSPWLIGVLLGLGGFLPLSPTDAHAAGILPEDQYRIEHAWNTSGGMFAGDFVPATSWQMARVRPANHPAYRIMQLATLLSHTNGNPLEPIISIIRGDTSPVEKLRQWTSRPWHPGIGEGRAIAITASVILPFVLAITAIDENDALEDAAYRVWAELPMGDWTQPARRALKQVTGGPTIRRLGERGHQGLLHLDRELCAPRKCHQCPIAAAVLREQLT